jgi:hypothetical protein
MPLVYETGARYAARPELGPDREESISMATSIDIEIIIE